MFILDFRIFVVRVGWGDGVGEDMVDLLIES